MIWKIIISILILSISLILMISSTKPTKKKYEQYVKEFYNEEIVRRHELITFLDLEHLPKPLKNYLEYVGVVGTEKVESYTMYITGEFKMNENQDYYPVVIHQTNYFENTSRFFYITMNMKGIKIAGLHHFKNGEAVMEIRPLDVFTAVKYSGEGMNRAESVTVFNDIVLFAPGVLVDERFTWEEITEYEVRGTFNNDGIVVSANLLFNEQFQLVNFISHDRYDDKTIEKNGVEIWSTPITEYHEINGINLPFKGSAVWTYQDREFEYAKLTIESVEYNKNIEE